jgi:hypothetical protein
MGVGLGTIEDPFSARWYRDIQRSLSHPTLAQRGSAGEMHNRSTHLALGHSIPLRSQARWA